MLQTILQYSLNPRLYLTQGYNIFNVVQLVHIKVHVAFVEFYHIWRSYSIYPFESAIWVQIKSFENGLSFCNINSTCSRTFRIPNIALLQYS